MVVVAPGFVLVVVPAWVVVVVGLSGDPTSITSGSIRYRHENRWTRGAAPGSVIVRKNSTVYPVCPFGPEARSPAASVAHLRLGSSAGFLTGHNNSDGVMGIVSMMLMQRGSCAVSVNGPMEAGSRGARVPGPWTLGFEAHQVADSGQGSR